MVVEFVILLNPVVTSYSLKRLVLRAFGAEVGAGVVIKPAVHIKHPWRLKIGDDCWIGERAWIDNLEQVTLGDDVCLSQGAYLCTGNHIWTDPRMPLVPQPITIQDGAWVAAFARVGPGVTIGARSVVAMGAVIARDVPADSVWAGNPATACGPRRLKPVA